MLTHSRESGSDLVASLKDGVASLNGKLLDHGVVTTPQLHYAVRCLNTMGAKNAYGEPTEEGYFAKISGGFVNIIVRKEVLLTQRFMKDNSSCFF